jgi:hypothetical protein
VLMRQGRFSGLLVLALLALLAADASLVGYSAANPYKFDGVGPPDQETYPPVITVTLPVNNTSFNTSLLALKFNVSAPQSRTAWRVNVASVTYVVDWKKEPLKVLNGGGQEQASFNLQLSDVPEGQHTILIEAVGHAYYKHEVYPTYKVASINSTATICFIVDRTAPTVLVLSPENVSETSTVPLNIVVNEVCSRIAYSLNGEQNVTVSGNSTIPHLAVGQYNVTFYAWDGAGNIGASEIANFAVAETPKTERATEGSFFLPAAAALSMFAMIGIVLLFKRRTKVKNSLVLFFD